MNTFVIIGILLVVMFAWFVSVYNKMIRYIEAIKNNQKQIDIQLDRRFKVFESLISVVKKYMDYEKTTLKDVVALRNTAQSAKDSGDSAARMQAENGISKIAGGINVAFENYPDLKSNTNFLNLQRTMNEVESQISAARRAYNAAVTDFNNGVQMFPSSIIAGMMHLTTKKVFEIPDVERQNYDAKSLFNS